MILEHGIWDAADAWQLTFMNQHLLRFNFPALHAQDRAVDASVDFNLGEWHPVAASYDGRSGTVYVGGKRAAARPVTLPLRSAGARAPVRSRPSGRGRNSRPSPVPTARTDGSIASARPGDVREPTLRPAARSLERGGPLRASSWPRSTRALPTAGLRPHVGPHPRTAPPSPPSPWGGPGRIRPWAARGSSPGCRR